MIATKFGHEDFDMPGTEGWGPKGGERYVRGAVEASLRRLRTDRIDLLQMHTPDPETPSRRPSGPDRAGGRGKGALHRALELHG
ncbi:aldo/keto reductase [Tessaracoccus coleopterorum]|uniref:aldo/keto reductase n=1 Tax=Tessaracoccus coleopterorum TaxID=2714950 RepID=UPI002F9127E6